MRLLRVVLFATACTKPLPQVTAMDATRGNVALAELQQGRTLAAERCGNCHRPPHPHDHRATEWPKQVAGMAERANLDGAQRALVERYFVVMATAP